MGVMDAACGVDWAAAPSAPPFAEPASDCGAVTPFPRTPTAPGSDGGAAAPSARALTAHASALAGSALPCTEPAGDVAVAVAVAGKGEGVDAAASTCSSLVWCVAVVEAAVGEEASGWLGKGARGE